MIVNWLIEGASAFWQWFIGGLPALPTPSWFASVSGSMTGITDHIAGLGAWLPFGLLGTVIGTFFAILAVGWTIKIVRIVVSFLPFIGGTSG